MAQNSFLIHLVYFCALFFLLLPFFAKQKQSKIEALIRFVESIRFLSEAKIFSCQTSPSSDQAYIFALVQKAILAGNTYKLETSALAFRLKHIASELKLETNFKRVFLMKMLCLQSFSLLGRFFLTQSYTERFYQRQVYFLDLLLLAGSLLVIFSSLRFTKEAYPKHWFFYNGELSSQARVYLALCFKQDIPCLTAFGTELNSLTQKANLHGDFLGPEKTALLELILRDSDLHYQSKLNNFQSVFPVYEFFQLSMASALLFAIPVLLIITQSFT